MENKLEHLEEFKQILGNYHISDESKRILADTKLVLLLAPSGGGRNTVIRELIKTGKYHFIISDTTRAPRINDDVLEKNGEEYWFRSEQDVLADLKAGKFLEAELIHNQQVSGISIRELRRAQDEKRIAITDVDMGGIQNVMHAKPDAKAILVFPPSFEEWQKRILKRGEMTANEHKRRLETAVKIFTIALKHEYFNFVINDTLEHAVEQIEAIMTYGYAVSQKEVHRLAEELLASTKEHLKAS